MEPNEITDPVHKSNIGEIVFLTGEFPVNDTNKDDLLTMFELEDNSRLNFKAFLGNSLTNYLHQIDSTLSVDELVEKGNYQFSFYLDNKLVYQENLHHGAGLPQEKNKDTILHKPLLSPGGLDSWGQFLWMRFMYRSNAFSILQEGTHTLNIELRPYLNKEEIIVGDIIAKGSISLAFAEPEVSENRINIQKIEENSGWDIYKSGYNREKIRALNERIAQDRFKDITSIVVIKDGKLLVEEYFNGADRNTLHNTRSVGKSFAATMTGIAIKDGYLKSTDQTLSEFYDLNNFDNYSPNKEKVTLKSLLTMSSGFEGDDSNYDSPGNEENMYPTDDWVKFALDLPMKEEKEIGKDWSYFTAGVVVLGDIIHKSVPSGLVEYADEKLFKPLGITDYQWQYTPQNVGNTAGGLQLRTLDYAKYGQLYKNNGQWNGKQVFPSEWAEQSLTNHFADVRNQIDYGFLFWNHTYKSGGNIYKAFQASGNGGNKVIIFEDEELVIVITSTAYGQPYSHLQSEYIVENYLLPALFK